MKTMGMLLAGRELLLMLAVVSAILCHAISPARADVLALRAIKLSSARGLSDHNDATSCNGLSNECRGLCDMSAAGPYACELEVSMQCQSTSSGDWCVMEIQLEADFNVSSSTTARMVVQGDPILRVARVSGPTWLSKVDGQPWRARWKFELATAVSVDNTIYPYTTPSATFVAAQGSQVRAVSLKVSPACIPAATSSVTFSTPQVDCKTGRLTATARLTGCPGFNREGQGYPEVFDGAITANPYTDDVFNDDAVNTVYRMWEEPGNPHTRTLSTTGPGAIKAVFTRYRQPNTWPEGVTSIRLGYRYIKDKDPTTLAPIWDPAQGGENSPSTWKMTGNTSVVPC